MTIFKQGGIIACIVLIAAFAWARMSPSATSTLSRLGVGPGTAALLTGVSASESEPGDATAGNSGDGRNSTPQAGQAGGNRSRETQAGSGSSKSQNAGGRSGGGRPPALVVTKPVSEALINDRLTAVGNGTALASVSVVPLSSGVLTKVLVRSGQQVAAGDVLAQLDAEEQTITRDRAARTAKDAAVDVTRLESLFKSRTTTQVELNRALAILADARLALREAQLMLSRRSITAPIDGMVGIVPVDKGNYVTTDTEIATIDDRSTIVVEFWIPERFAGLIKSGQLIKAKAFANPGRALVGTISAIGSRVEQNSRTLLVQASIDNADDSLRPGMSFEVELSFTGETFPAIDPLAVQWDSNGSFVWRLVDEKVKREPIRIVQRNPESVLIEAELQVGDEVVTEGVLSLRPGAPVRVAGSR